RSAGFPSSNSRSISSCAWAMSSRRATVLAIPNDPRLRARTPVDTLESGWGMAEDVKKPLGRILVNQRALTPSQLDAALADAPTTGVPLASRLTEAGTVSELAALKALSEQSGVPGMDLNQVCIRLSELAILPREIAVRHKLLPVLVR